MEIAVIGWGSLIWDPGALAIRSQWRKDGPRLPIEFARVSQDGRLTLVVHAPSREQQTYWALSALNTAEAAKTNLAKREGSAERNICLACRDQLRGRADPIEVAVHRWLKGRSIDAAIWTGLSATLKGPDVVAAAVNYLLGLGSVPVVHERAKEYVVNAPRQIQTAVRSEMQRHGWADVEPPAELFEPD